MTPSDWGRQRLCRRSPDLDLGSRTSPLSLEYVIIVTDACEKAGALLSGRAKSVGLGKGIRRDLTQQPCQ